VSGASFEDDLEPGTFPPRKRFRPDHLNLSPVDRTQPLGGFPHPRGPGRGAGQRPARAQCPLDQGDNDFWGVALAEDPNGDRIVLASDRDFGLYIFRYTG
jgi:hypothetical protein